MCLSRLLRACAAAGAVLLVGASVTRAQQLGTIYLDFDGDAATPQGAVTPLDAGVFPGLTSADT